MTEQKIILWCSLRVDDVEKNIINVIIVRDLLPQKYIPKHYYNASHNSVTSNYNKATILFSSSYLVS